MNPILRMALVLLGLTMNAGHVSATGNEGSPAPTLSSVALPGTAGDHRIIGEGHRPGADVLLITSTHERLTVRADDAGRFEVQWSPPPGEGHEVASFPPDSTALLARLRLGD